MTRFLTDHVVNTENDKLVIEVKDKPGAGGANHSYKISGYNGITNPSLMDGNDIATSTVIIFQNGPINENGVNGLTQEALLAIVIDRLRSFQKGSFASAYNMKALAACDEAMKWLHQRTIDRMQRNVEGTSQK